MEGILSLFTEEFFYAVIRMASPIILAAVGEVVLERAGVINLGVESVILFGAFFGVLGSYWFHNAWLGLLTALVAGAVLGLIFGFAVITMQAHQAVTGTALNVLGVGLTSLLNRTIWGVRAIPIQVENIPSMPIPVLSDLPVVGRIFFDHTPLVYFSYIMVGVVAFLLYRTTWGLKIRAVGENPRAAETMGVRVVRWRYSMAIFACCMGALAGTILSLCFMNVFTDNISSGRGYMAIATVILGQWSPLGVLLGGLLFGAGNALQMRLQTFGVAIPNDLLLVFPMFLALLVILIIKGKDSAKPAALGMPYEKGGSSL